MLLEDFTKVNYTFNVSVYEKKKHTGSLKIISKNYAVGEFIYKGIPMVQ